MPFSLEMASNIFLQGRWQESVLASGPTLLYSTSALNHADSRSFFWIGSTKGSPANCQRV